MTLSEPKSNEEAISMCVKAAIERLDRVEENANKKKTEIVQDLAKDFEGKIPTNRICNEIVHQLRGKVHERLIRRCLDEKYKEKRRVTNARKQKRKHESTEDSAASVPLEQETPKQQIAATQDGKSVIINETSRNTASISRTNESDSEKCPNCSELEEALRKATTLSTAELYIQQ